MKQDEQKSANNTDGFNHKNGDNISQLNVGNNQEVSSSANSNEEIGKAIVEKGLISIDQLDMAEKEMARMESNDIGEVLVLLGFVTESALGEVISQTAGIEKFDVKSVVLDSDLVRKVPKDVAIKYKIVPVALKDDTITVAVHDVFDVIAIDKVKKYFPQGTIIDPIFCSEVDILDIIDQYYEYEMSIDGILKEIENTTQGIESEVTGEDFRNPVVRLVDSFLIDAVHCGASDIHFEPEENFLRVRYKLMVECSKLKLFIKIFGQRLQLENKNYVWYEYCRK